MTKEMRCPVIAYPETMLAPNLRQTIHRNCDISDARDNGIYSICMLFLRLRNLYKWEHHIEPWDEPESEDLLAWIAAKEEYWDSIENEPFTPITIDNKKIDPFDINPINEELAASGLIYGAGFGRSMKAVFFLTEKTQELRVEGYRTLVLGKEEARELASPFAMSQEGVIYFRREPFRSFLWDRIQETRPSGKHSLLHALDRYGVLNDKGMIDRCRLADQLDYIADNEMMPIIHHEVGEMQENPLDSKLLHTIVKAFPDSPIELLARSTKDVLADTHPKGMLGHIIAEQKEKSLGLYVAFLDGFRRLLFPEIGKIVERFYKSKDWREVDQAREVCRDENRRRAEKLIAICAKLETTSPGHLKTEIEKELLAPLGIKR